jgi:hypothetical protein
LTIKKENGKGGGNTPRTDIQSKKVRQTTNHKRYAIDEIESGLMALGSGTQKPSAPNPEPKEFLGGYAEGVTPVPIPNTEVKPLRVDGTARVAVWESRSPPGILLMQPLFLLETRAALRLKCYYFRLIIDSQR